MSSSLVSITYPSRAGPVALIAGSVWGSAASGHDNTILRRRYLDGDSAADVAADLGITIANLDQRTTRAKRALR